MCYIGYLQHCRLWGRRATESEYTVSDDVVSRLLPITWHNLPRADVKNIQTLEQEIRLNDIAILHNSVDITFSYLNPHYPCLNGNQFRAQFESFPANDTSQMINTDWHQFVALLNLIQAEVAVLSNDWPNSSRAPAWEKFCRA